MLECCGQSSPCLIHLSRRLVDGALSGQTDALGMHLGLLRLGKLIPGNGVRLVSVSDLRVGPVQCRVGRVGSLPGVFVR